MQTGKRLWFLVVALVFLDQITKLLARILDPNNAFFTFVGNPGATLGILPGSNEVLIVVSVFAALLLYVAITRSSGIDATAYAVVLAGVLGNCIDRVLFGMVSDFIRFFGLFVFNLADVYITVAVALLLLLELPWFRSRYF